MSEESERKSLKEKMEERARKMKEGVKKRAEKVENWISQTSWFKKLTKTVFDMCDRDKSGDLDKPDLYTGILYAHLYLAKYAGRAACSPPTREVVYELFDASDDDGSGTIDINEFGPIMVICTANISSRIVIYYSLIIIAVPFLAGFIIDNIVEIDVYLGWNTSSGPLKQYFDLFESFMTYGALAESLLATVLTMFAIPLLFDYLDTFSRSQMERVNVPKKDDDTAQEVTDESKKED